jgi:uncharacterized protein YcnI
MTKKTIGAAVLTAAATALVVPALSSGHATVSAIQPQGSSALLTAARATYALRVPNEQDTQSTWKVVMYVPGPVQGSISVRKLPGWTVRLTRAENKTSRISWTANAKDAEIEPGFYEQFEFRLQNPAEPAVLCFPASQYYRNADGSRRKSEIVEWQGDPAKGAEHPKSCLSITK